MNESSTPEMDKWHDIHARACKAEHEMMMQALSFITAGSLPPATHQIESAKMLRVMASVQFDKAMAEVLGLSQRLSLGSRLQGTGGTSSSDARG